MTCFQPTPSYSESAWIRQAWNGSGGTPLHYALLAGRHRGVVRQQRLPSAYG